MLSNKTLIVIIIIILILGFIFGWWTGIWAPQMKQYKDSMRGGDPPKRGPYDTNKHPL